MHQIKQNFLSPVSFSFEILRLPHVNFFVQKVSIPGVNMSAVEQPSPFKSIYRPGDKIEYDDISLSFKVDEEMANYQELMGWMVGMTFPKNFRQYANLVDGDGLYSDASLIIMSSGKNPNILIKMEDVFPTSLSGIDMDAMESDVVAPTCQVTFKVNQLSFENIS